MVKVQHVLCFFLFLNFFSSIQMKNPVNPTEKMRKSLKLIKINDDLPTLREKNGYYYATQVKDFQEMNTFNQNPPFEVLLEETVNDTNITIIVEDFFEDSNYVGKKGALALITNFTDENNIFDKLNIESQTKFKTIIISNETKDYEINCRLFKYTEIPLKVFCELDENIPKGNYSINFNNITFKYNDKEITINSDKNFDFEKKDVYMPDLYSDIQNITVDKNKESIELKFKINSYHNETIILWGFDENLEILDNCKEENNELTCIIQKDTLLEIMPNDTSFFALIYSDNNNYESYFYLNVEYIIINYYSIEKEDIFVGINKLIENKFGFDDLAIYETNVTNISNFHSGINLFSMKFEGVEENYCSFNKYDDTPLLLLCGIVKYSTNEMYLSEIENETILDNINIKYNFRIQPVKNNQKIIFKDTGELYLTLNYPNILDFTNQDTLNITFYGSFELKNDFPIRIKLNLNGTSLECEKKKNF